MATGDIRERAKALEKLLGHANARPPSAGPSLKGKPFTLASANEWTTAWAESEAAVITVAVDGFRNWTRLWTLGELRIDGGMVTGPTGCVQGPPPMLVAAMLASSLLPSRGEARLFCERAAAVLDTWFGSVRDMLSVPTLLWYPMFVAHPGPTAPPTPSVPGRLSDMAQLAGGLLSPAMLAENLYGRATTPDWSKHFGDNKLGDNKSGDLGRIVCERIAKDLVSYTQQVFQIAVVQGVMGFGTVLGYAPPAVTVGRVIGRTIPCSGFLRAVDGVPSPLLTRA
jgi:hypothetical protein